MAVTIGNMCFNRRESHGRFCNRSDPTSGANIGLDRSGTGRTARFSKTGREKGFPESALEQRQSIHIEKVMSGSKPSAVASTVAAL